jgi:glycosyltransferase involved in cell wall biosynthesis
MAKTIPKLTVAIPTFNRCERLMENLAIMITNSANPIVFVQIIDNGSIDGTYETISNFLSIQRKEIQDSFSIIKFEKNLGFHESFLRVLDTSKSEYTLLLSDEDELINSGVEKLLYFFKDNSFDFISPQILRNFKLYRGRNQTRSIKFKEVENSSFYLSGLTFRTDIAKSWSNWIRELAISEVSAQLYPQVLLAQVLTLTGPATWFSEQIASVGIPLESSIVHETEEPYWSLNSRLDQFESWKRLEAELIRIAAVKADSNAVREIKRSSRLRERKLWEVIINAMSHRNADYEKVLVSSFVNVFFYKVKVKLIKELRIITRLKS